MTLFRIAFYIATAILFVYCIGVQLGYFLADEATQIINTGAGQWI